MMRIERGAPKRVPFFFLMPAVTLAGVDLHGYICRKSPICSADYHRRGPSFGDTDFVPILQALKDVKNLG
jgi:hypothetical protein